MYWFGLATFFFLGFSVAALQMVPPAFNLDRHGVLGLGAQQYKKAWLLKQGMINYAVLMSGNLIYHFFMHRAPLPVMALLLLGALCFGLTAIFAPRPFLKGRPVDEKSALWHHRLVMSGMAFYLAAIFYTLIFHSVGYLIFFNLAFLFVIVGSVLLSRRDAKTRGLYESIALLACMLWPIFLYPRYF